MLESYSYTTMETGAAPAGWGPNTMIDAGAPPELVFDVLEGAFQVKVRTFRLFVLCDWVTE